MAESAGTQPPRRARLTSRLLVLVLLASVPLAALLIASAINDRREATDKAHERTSEIVAIGAVVVRSIILRTDLLLTTIGQLSTPTGAVCASELRAAVLPGSTYENLYSVAEDGTIECTALRVAGMNKVSETVWFRHTEARSDLTVTVPALGVTTGDPVMIVSTPRPAPLEPDEQPPEPVDPDELGVLAASLDPQQLVAFADNVELPSDSAVLVVNQDGVVVARTPDDEEHLLEPDPAFDEMKGEQSGTVDAEGVDGVARLYSFERIDLGGESLYMVTGISRAEAVGSANRRLFWSLVVIGVLGAGVGALAFAASRSLVVRPVDRLRAAIAGFRAGDISRRAGDIGGPAEVTELGVAFDALADEIQQRLENQQRLLRQLEEASEAERQSIAAGIHDETLQNLSAVGIRLQLVRRAAEGAQRDELDRALAVLDDTASQLRDLLFDLRPPSFDHIGLAATLRETLEVRFSAELDSWSVVGDAGPGVTDDARTMLYRVAQQALANIREHAGAHRVDIRIATTDSSVAMEITDDGRGFDVASVERDQRPGHIGLSVMRDRALALGGELVVTSAPGVGTTVRVEVPLAGSPGPEGRTDGGADEPGADA